MDTFIPSEAVGKAGSALGAHLRTVESPVPEAGKGSFKDMLSGLVSQVDGLQKDADASIRGLMAGEDVRIHDVTIKMQEAGVAFDLMMEIRTKLMDAYQQIVKIQS